MLPQRHEALDRLSSNLGLADVVPFLMGNTLLGAGDLVPAVKTQGALCFRMFSLLRMAMCLAGL